MSKARPLGTKKLAPAPVPSSHAAAPLPTKAVTTPLLLTLRRRWPLLSHTTSAPSASNFMSCGRAKLAAVPTPLATAYSPLPAKVVTSPAGDRARMRLPRSSAMYTVPPASMAAPEGKLKRACAAGQGVGTWAVSAALPALPSPASVLTFQKHRGCASSPATGQALAGTQGTTAAGLPPGQKLPTGHSCTAGPTDPAAQPHPGAPLQLPLQAGVLRSASARPNVPAGHSRATLSTQ